MKTADSNCGRGQTHSIEKSRQKWKEHVQLMSADSLRRTAKESRRQRRGIEKDERIYNVICFGKRNVAPKSLSDGRKSV
jgi:hypothetical protein